MPPIDLSSYESCRDEFWGLSRATLELFWPKFLDRGSTPSRSKRVELPKCCHFDRKEQSSGFSVLAR